MALSYYFGQWLIQQLVLPYKPWWVLSEIAPLMPYLVYLINLTMGIIWRITVRVDNCCSCLMFCWLISFIFYVTFLFYVLSYFVVKFIKYNDWSSPFFPVVRSKENSASRWEGDATLSISFFCRQQGLCLRPSLSSVAYSRTRQWQFQRSSNMFT